MPQGRDGAGGGRKRELASAMIARLEDELRKMQRRLEEEAALNLVARARIPLLGAFAECRVALGQRLAAEEAPEGQRAAAMAEALESMQRADELVGAVRRTLGSGEAPPPPAPPPAARGGGDEPACPALAAGDATACTNSSGASSSTATTVALAAGAGGGASGAAQQLGMGASLSRMIEIVIEATRLELDMDGFIAWWRARLSKLAVVLVQVQSGISTPESLEESLYEMSAAFGGLFLVRPWFAELMTLNMDKRAPERQPPGWWGRVARAMEPTERQVPLLHASFSWVRSANIALRGECDQIARRAVDAEAHDPEGHAALLFGLERLQRVYRVTVVAHKMVVMAALLQPPQLAMLYIQAWPYMPMLVGVLEDMAAETG
ncbi:hypothetical protein Rsub_06076 [Raphidocelis subcapitata]|uniref:Uncharacterized protein n=1 Tax=Raphidocelis subcapitata TaxID=307507 RepID=A0A2V0P1K3_9CHLO|nr:hypothetical protein Rsub_06076 [Raphidocelis subcapitata]|eukprot:GBF93744.1 hypothetical protein Rsub_06076 [Raphidocelis subcapitata]